MNIIKRDGSEVTFSKQKIVDAIAKANRDVINQHKNQNILSIDQIESIANNIEEYAKESTYTLSVEEVQDLVEERIVGFSCYPVAKSYITYRYQRSLDRRNDTTDKAIISLVNQTNEEIKQENSNKNSVINSTQRDYIAGEVCKSLAARKYIPKDIWDAHENGLIHIHDTDYVPVMKMLNCCLVNLKDMFENNTVISNVLIETPRSFRTACNIMTQIIAQVASNQYGGQSVTLSHLAPFVDIERQKIRKRIYNQQIAAFKFMGFDVLPKDYENILNEMVEAEVKEAIKDGIQTIQYQLLTLLTTNGQTPFVTIFAYLNEVEDEQTKADLALIIEEMLKQRYQGVKDETGVYITPAFPKIIYVLEEDNITPDSKYWYLTCEAAKCSAKRLVPDYISEKVMKNLKDGYTYSSMGCRSFLAPWYDSNGNAKFWGRSNMGVVTINLVDVACSSNGDYDKFWKIFDERLELCHRMLLIRYENLLGTNSDVAPILWQYGALCRLKKGEKIDKMLKNGYMSISLGYAGLAECVKRMTGKYHTDPESTPFALEVMKHMNDKCNEWKAETGLGFSIYGTPIESTTYKFAKCLQKRFGKIEGVTDRNYITNSYHVPVFENIDAFSKLKFESQFQELSTGGAISYVEVPNMQDNIEAVLTILQFIYDNIMYAEINTKSDYCEICGFDGEIVIEEDKDTGKLYWKCPSCGNTDEGTMHVARRTCGYIGSQFWNQGRTQEIRDRVLHL